MLSPMGICWTRPAITRLHTPLIDRHDDDLSFFPFVIGSSRFSVDYPCLLGPSLLHCRYGDYELTSSGLQFKDLKEGAGEVPQAGDTCVVDWDGEWMKS